MVVEVFKGCMLCGGHVENTSSAYLCQHLGFIGLDSMAAISKTVINMLASRGDNASRWWPLVLPQLYDKVGTDTVFCRLWRSCERSGAHMSPGPSQVCRELGIQ
jgi:hypothetical protein